MLELIGISKSYKNNKKVVDNVNLIIKAGNICCLLGKNGAGKSTLINILAQTTKQDEGKVFINKNLFNGNATWIKAEMGIVSQYDHLINQLSGLQFLIFQSLVFNLAKSKVEERIQSLVDYFFDDSNDVLKPISSYSSGMRMKLRIISALLHQPKILLLDEPFANLDPIASERLITLLKELIRSDDKVVLISSHDLLYVNKIATQVCVIDNTNIVFNGSKDDFTKTDNIKLDESLLDLISTKIISTEKISWLF